MSPALSSAPVAFMERRSSATPDAMEDTLASETRLLGELGANLRRQRDAVAADDLVLVEQTVYATHRILTTLGEARRRRRSLRDLMGPPAGDVQGGPFRDAYDRLRTAALALHDEVEVSQGVLREALASTDEQVRTPYAGVQEQGFYDSTAAPAPVAGGSEGNLFNRRA